jgi:hypothetical protein
MKVGIGTRNITPEIGETTLSGWGSRGSKLTEGKYDDLKVKSMAFSSQDRRGLIVTLDLLGLNRDLDDKVRERLVSRFKLSPEDILITSSHTHSGPPSGYIDTPILSWKPEGNYSEFLTDAVEESCVEAFGDLETCELYMGTGSCNISINRRKIVDGNTYMLPNEEGTRDSEVIAVKVQRKDGSVKAVLFHYACHPTTVYSYNVTADYPGEAKKVIERDMGGDVTAIFLQGCCGNVRPRLIEGEKFRSGTIEDSRRFGEELGGEVIRICESNPVKLVPRLFTAWKEIGLTFAGRPSQEELKRKSESGNDRERKWAQVILSYGDKVPTANPFRIHRFDLAEELSLIGLEGEVCVEYQLAIKKLSEKILNLAVGYSNGCIGYIPTAQIIGEGGYEANSVRDWGAPSVYSTEIEEMLISQVSKLVE